MNNATIKRNTPRLDERAIVTSKSSCGFDFVTIYLIRQMTPISADKPPNNINNGENQQQ